MNDILLELGQNPRARRVIKAIGLPIPLPEKLRRERGPWTERPIFDHEVAVAATAGAELVPTMAHALTAAGANPWLSMPEELHGAWKEPGEVYGRPARALEALDDKRRLNALVFDATGIRDAAGLRAVYDFFHPLVARLARSGRVLVLGRADAGGPVERVAAQAALEGFVRSVAKEIGRTGATANLVLVAEGAEARLAPVLRWILSPRSAFVTAQPIVVTARARGGSEPSFVRPLEKKVALVTGAARGIGAATARLLAAEGAHVVCLDRPADDGPTSQLAREIGGSALAVDLAAPDAPETIAAALRASGGVDVVVHNAGITRDKTLARMSAEQWDMVLDVNLAAVLRLTTAIEPVIKDGGRIVCLSSIAGLAGNVGQSSYAASKAGIVGVVRALAGKFEDRGITVNAIAPGFIETRLTAAVPIAIREAARRLSALGQGGQPEDVGQAVVFLASPGAQGVTGRVLRVCGGAFVGA